MTTVFLVRDWHVDDQVSEIIQIASSEERAAVRVAREGPFGHTMTVTPASLTVTYRMTTAKLYFMISKI